ncbi:MAG: succinyl-diaminopimelate desuccinylase, partial [Campylobacterota bacterium]|nr:succinyl-diaminopimelate desuccinylase [Campylobacterota bacterium]
STKTIKEDVENFVNNNFKGLDYTLKLTQGSKPFITNKDSLLISHTANAIKKITGIDTRLTTTGGTSDARFFGEFSVQTVEFGVVNDTIHAPNEKTTIKELNALEEVFLEIIKSF